MAGITASRLSAPVAAPPPVVRTSVSLAGATLTGTNHRILAFSPDGSRIVYSANDRLYVRSMDQTEATPLRGTEGAESPFFAPDSDWVGFWSNGQLQKITIRGGAPVSLCDADVPYGARWGTNDSIVFGQRGAGIFRVSAAGGEPEILVPLQDGERTVHGPQVLPGGRAVLFTLGDMGDWDNAGIVVQSLETGERRVLIERGRDARYLSTGHLVYALDEVLFAVPFDVNALEVSGSALAMIEGVRTAGTASGATQFSVSDTGSLIYLRGSELKRTLVWVDRNGREEPIAAEPRGYAYPRISPDGSRIVLDVRDQENDLWIWELARETLTRLTFDPAPDLYPVWTPDGRRVAFASSRNGEADLYWKAADGTGSAERLSEGGIGALPYAFTPDGRKLVYQQAQTTSTDLVMFSLDGTVEPLLASAFAERNVEFSPDGRWMAYESNASGRFEIYVRPFPNVEEGQWLISRGGGARPLWAPDGRELFYLAPGARLMSVSVDVDTAGGFAFGNAEELFRGYFGGYDGRTYDITPDGKRFLMIQDGAEEGNELILVQNWISELERLAPIDR